MSPPVPVSEIRLSYPRQWHFENPRNPPEYGSTSRDIVEMYWNTYIMINDSERNSAIPNSDP